MHTHTISSALRLSRRVALATMLSMLAACSRSSGDAIPTEPPPGTGNGGGGGGSGQATLTVTNQSPSNTAMFIRTRSCGAPSWGPDMLGNGILGKGESVSKELPGGCYDVRVTPSEYGVGYLYFNGVQLDAGQTKVLTITAFPPE